MVTAEAWVIAVVRVPFLAQEFLHARAQPKSNLIDDNLKNVPEFLQCTKDPCLQVHSFIKNSVLVAWGGFLGGLVVRTQCFYHCSLGSIPGPGTKISRQAAACLGQKKNVK